MTDFQKKIIVVFSMKFATKSVSYISPYFKGVTPLFCKTKRPKLAKFCCT